jgi:hypothetical protein
MKQHSQSGYFFHFLKSLLFSLANEAHRHSFVIQQTRTLNVEVYLRQLNLLFCLENLIYRSAQTVRDFLHFLTFGQV